ncbi:hypothetical protein Taro_014028, partial [Colocasia esculenta]|nr:hypothetical protein [Colocasia esculenta]
KQRPIRHCHCLKFKRRAARRRFRPRRSLLVVDPPCLRSRPPGCGTGHPAAAGTTPSTLVHWQRSSVQGHSRRFNVERVFSLGDDLIAVLNMKREIDNLKHCLEGAEALHSSCEAEFHEVRSSLEAIRENIGDLEHQRLSIKEQRASMKKKERDELRMQNTLCMCAQVTRIIPDLVDQTRISGYIVNGDKKKFERFEFESASSSFETCDRLWKMIDP